MDDFWRIVCHQCGDDKRAKVWRESCGSCAEDIASRCRSQGHDVKVTSPRIVDFVDSWGVRRLTGGRA